MGSTLAGRVCECYQVVKTESDRLLLSPSRGPLTTLIRLVRYREHLKANESPLPLDGIG